MTAMPAPIRHLRFGVAALLCLASTLNYLDRQTLSVLADTIKRELGLSASDYANITSAFLVSYSYQDGTITISGLAQSASEIQNLLESSPVFKGVEFSNSVTREPAGKDRFTLRMLLEAQK